ncbi:low molecular weight phosphatase family protein [Mycobacterium intracellulare]|uniref:arsenate-mycothiol transferase ArsC n=1 Tax=Mycobacterium intracellulare TaxID=1767 RepID=UPI001CD9CBFA|nr:low molecular weight phosphatase family protein [Mycobacterium intracellulare]MCA2248819.1 low molecular weight phosphatase family protein [Mycobacterium intracellulare]
MTGPHISFVCRYNRGRSPIAAAVLSEQLRRRGLADAVRVTSAGTCPTPGTGLDPLAAQVLLARGYPVPAHRATPVGDDHLGADLVVALGFEHVGNLQRRGVDDDRIRYVEVRNPWRAADFEVAFDRIGAAMPQLNAWVDDRLQPKGSETAVGWRFWLVAPGTDVLTAPYQSGLPWTSTRYHAVCTSDRRHVPPHPNCWCGIYADVNGPAGVCGRAVWHQPEFGGISDAGAAVVVGRVALEGAVTCVPRFCTTPELRAGAATIEELWILPVRRAPDSGRLVGPLRDRYRVPVLFGVPC